ncbi:hypothetical protein A1O1_00888 [Capronia coronata CBS 617.96]|uniref:Methylated-DNA--protein-cysteine methyltransferase n=1 Tax=Capronia coronata CBS 617.96 TaxID=1182541 RepID=W9ZMN8_9EURO|nr:uncharacterized protein A1O1_00888 [Capronia coronata CBS 617.96]EXJ95764.1 hypothetical protein A1O1_00888 [Capronia coronata CBS 617.96]
MSDLESLRKRWTILYSQTLPQLAKSRSPVQAKWPVCLDHCFARIILDYVVGLGERQWDQVIGKPAIRNMSQQQLHDAITLGNQITSGEADLCYLDEISLQCRGKHKDKHNGTVKSNSHVQVAQAPAGEGSKKRTITDATEGTESVSDKRARLEKGQSTLHFVANARPAVATSQPSSVSHELKQMVHSIRSHPSLTPYRKKLYLTLLSVPEGRYTTYAAMSDYLNSSARAVGSGMRNNPFAPEVPCHRVLAANGTIGGFHGDWGKDGKFADRKVELLRSEGVRFDGHGKVVGEPFRLFHSFGQIE